MGVPYAPNIRKWPYLCNGWSDPLHVWFYGRVFVDGGSNGAISSSNKFKMAAAAILEKFQMAISPQRLTVYLYSAHRAVIFAIAQLSCSINGVHWYFIFWTYRADFYRPWCEEILITGTRYYYVNIFSQTFVQYFFLHVSTLQCPGSPYLQNGCSAVG